MPYSIPSSFYLFGQKITVIEDPTISGKHGDVGHAVYNSSEIRIQAEVEGVFTRPQSQREQWFFHELVHHILHQMYEPELRSNEKFVDLFASLLHQAMATADYSPGLERTDVKRDSNL